MRYAILIVSAALLILSAACPGERTESSEGARNGEAMGRSADISSIAESYVRAVLALGVHDGDYVDSY